MINILIIIISIIISVNSDMISVNNSNINRSESQNDTTINNNDTSSNKIKSKTCQFMNGTTGKYRKWTKQEILSYNKDKYDDDRYIVSCNVEDCDTPLVQYRRW